MKRLLAVTAAIAVLTAANLRSAEERKAEGGKAAAPAITINSGTLTVTPVGTSAAGVWGGKSAAQWYIESIDKIVVLTDAQKKAITQTIEARDKFMQEFQAQNKEKLQAAGKAIGAAFQSKDKEQTAQAQNAYQDLYAPMHEAMKKSQQALDEVLTPEQREKLQDNRMAALIKTLTDPVQLSGEQLGKVKAAYREAAKKGEPEAMRTLSEVVQNVLTPEQKTTIVKQRATNYVKGAFGRAKLSDEQMKKAEAMIAELAKDPDPKMQWQVYGKLYEKINALLTPEQKEAMKAPFTLSNLAKAGGGTVILGNSNGNLILVEGAKAEGGKVQPKPADAGKPVENPAKKQEPAAKPGEKKESGATLRLNAVPGGGLQIIIGEGGKIEIKSPDAGKPGENPAKKQEGGVSIQKLPGGGIQVTIREAPEGKEGQQREALEKARRSLEEAARLARSRLFEKVKRQHELVEQAWQLAQTLQALGEDKKAETHALREILEAIEGQLRGTLQPAPGTPQWQRREATLQPAPGARPAPGGWVQVQPGVATYSLEAQTVPSVYREVLELRLKSLLEAAEQLTKEGKVDQAKAVRHDAQEVHEALEQLGRQSRAQPRPGQPLVNNLVPGQPPVLYGFGFGQPPVPFNPIPGQPVPPFNNAMPGQPPLAFTPMPGQPPVPFSLMPGQPVNVHPDPAIQELGRQVQELRRQVEELKAIVKKPADSGKK